jgi:hypothetical protein
MANCVINYFIFIINVGFCHGLDQSTYSCLRR